MKQQETKKKIGSSLEAEVVIVLKDNDLLNLIKSVAMEDICIVSSFMILKEETINKDYLASSLS